MTNTAADPKPATGTEDWQQYAKHRGRILHHESVNPVITSIIVEKPDGFDFEPGDAVQLALDIEGKREDKNPMAIASLPHQRRLEFFIHTADGESDFNVALADAKVGTRVLFDDAESMVPRQDGGVYIAGGGGLTAFVSIFRDLDRRGEIDGNRLFMVNETRDEVFLQSEMFRTFGHSVTSTLTKQEHRDFEHGEVDKQWLESRVKTFDQPFFVAGPPSMVKDIAATIEQLGGEVHTVSWPGAL